MARGLVCLGLLALGCASAKTQIPGSDAGPGGDAGADGSLTPDAGSDGGAGQPDAARDGAPAGPDASTQRMLRDDLAADFGAAGSVLQDAVAEPWGIVEPFAYFTGGLDVVASNTGNFTSGPGTTWATVAAYPLTGKHSVTRSTDVDWGAGMPLGVGLTDGDSFTMLYQGEIYLDPGAWSFSLLCDDHGFLELAAPGTTSYARVLSADWSAESTGSYTAAAAGWYPLRMATSEQAGGASIRLRASGPGLAGPVAVPGERLRARADAATGWVMQAWDDFNALGAWAATLDQTAPGNVNWGTGMPADLGLADADLFTTRWSGQARFDSAAAYTFAYSTDDGQRLWIDGNPVLTSWDNATHAGVTGVLNLEAGWHDFVVDQQEGGGAAAALLSIASGPGAGAPIPIGRTRPVVGRDERVMSGYDPTDRPIPDVATIEAPLVIDAPAGAQVRGLEVGYIFTHNYPNDLVINLVAPDGSSVNLRSRTGGTTLATLTDRQSPAGFNGKAAAGTWKLRVTDAAGADVGTLLEWSISVHHGGGAAPIAATAHYVSPLRDLGNVTRWDLASWGALAPAGTSVTLRLRSCNIMAECGVQAWSGALASPAGSANPVPIGRYLQYRVDFTSNGDASPALDWVRIDYTTSP